MGDELFHVVPGGVVVSEDAQDCREDVVDGVYGHHKGLELVDVGLADGAHCLLGCSHLRHNAGELLVYAQTRVLNLLLFLLQSLRHHLGLALSSGRVLHRETDVLQSLVGLTLLDAQLLSLPLSLLLQLVHLVLRLLQLAQSHF